MNIELSLIQPSPNPIRSSWDEDKMQELTDSIKEQGLIVPIKVRTVKDLKECRYHGIDYLGDEFPMNPDAQEPCFFCGEYEAEVFMLNDDFERVGVYFQPFEIVYGHRRVEACRRAGLESVEAIVEGMDDTNALIQAGIENLSKEDMSAFDKGAWVESAKQQTGWSINKLAKKVGVSNHTIGSWHKYYLESIAGTAVGRSSNYGDAIQQTVEIRKALDDPILKRKVADKVERDGLTWRETRKVAEAVAQAEDEAEREAILSTSPNDPMFEQMVRAKANVHRRMEREQTKKRQEDPREVRAFLDSVRTFRAVCQEAVAVAEYGKFSPEAKQFAIRQLDRLIADIEQLKSQLEV